MQTVIIWNQFNELLKEIFKESFREIFTEFYINHSLGDLFENIEKQEAQLFKRIQLNYSKVE